MATHRSPDWQALLPTNDDIESYASGFYVSQVIVPDRVLDEALHGMERFYASDRDAPFPGRRRSTTWLETGDGDVLRKNDYASLQVGELANLVRYPMIGAVAARLAGTPLVRLWHDQPLYKPIDRPDRPANVGWHGPAILEELHLRPHADRLGPLPRRRRGHGPLTFLDGSHRRSTTSSGLDFFNHDLDGPERRLRENGHDVRKRVATLRRGRSASTTAGPSTAAAPTAGRRGGRWPSTCSPLTTGTGASTPRADRRALQRPPLPPGRRPTRLLDPDLFPVLWDEARTFAAEAS